MKCRRRQRNIVTTGRNITGQVSKSNIYLFSSYSFLYSIFFFFNLEIVENFNCLLQISIFYLINWIFAAETIWENMVLIYFSVAQTNSKLFPVDQVDLRLKAVSKFLTVGLQRIKPGQNQAHNKICCGSPILALQRIITFKAILATVY